LASCPDNRLDGSSRALCMTARGPADKARQHTQCGRLARQFTPQARQILIDIANDPGEEARTRIVAIGMLYDRAWASRRTTTRRRIKRRSALASIRAVTRPSSSPSSSGCFVWSRQRRPGPRRVADVVSPHVISELDCLNWPVLPLALGQAPSKGRRSDGQPA